MKPLGGVEGWMVAEALSELCRSKSVCKETVSNLERQGRAQVGSIDCLLARYQVGHLDRHSVRR